MQEDIGYINSEVRAMYGIPYGELTPEQKRILHEDSVRRDKLIARVRIETMQNGKTAFINEAEMEQELIKLYSECLDKILASVMRAIAEVEKNGGTWSYANMSELTRNRGLYEQIAEILKELTQTEREAFYSYLSNLYTDQYLREIYTLGQYTTVKANLNIINAQAVKKAIEYPWSGAMFSDRLWLDKQRLLQSLRSNLSQSMVLGEGIREVSQRMQKALDTSLYNSERVIRTETKRVSYIAHVESFKSTGVKQIKYSCANDDRACEVCKADHDKIYNLGEEPTLPRHPNCRCIYIPVVPDTFKPNELNELTGSIRGAENYWKWIEANREKLNPDLTLKEGWVRDWKNGGVLVYRAPQDELK